VLQERGFVSDSKNIRNDFALCEGYQSSPACPSDKNSINLLNLAVSLRATRFTYLLTYLLTYSMVQSPS